MGRYCLGMCIAWDTWAYTQAQRALFPGWSVRAALKGFCKVEKKQAVARERGFVCVCLCVLTPNPLFPLKAKKCELSSFSSGLRDLKEFGCA